jgi:hypothetical protein
VTVVLILKLWNHVCLISFPCSAGKVTDVLECSVKSSCPVCPFLATSRVERVV